MSSMLVLMSYRRRRVPRTWRTCCWRWRSWRRLGPTPTSSPSSGSPPTKVRFRREKYQGYAHLLVHPYQIQYIHYIYCILSPFTDPTHVHNFFKGIGIRYLYKVKVVWLDLGLRQDRVHKLCFLCILVFWAASEKVWFFSPNEFETTGKFSTIR